MTITDDELKAMAVELCLLRGEQPKSVDRGGVERWERYKPLAEGALREAERLFALRQSSPPDGQTAPEPFTLSWWNSKDLMVSITELGEVMVNDRDAFQALFDAMPEVEHGGIKCIHVRPTPSPETKAPGEEH